MIIESILNTPTQKAPLRIQRFIMFLQKYDFVVNYASAKDIICSDTLSRTPLKQQTPEISETEVNF